MKIINSLAPIVLITVLAMPVSAVNADTEEVIGVEDLDEVQSEPGIVQTLVLPDGRDFALPEPGMEVRYEALTAEGSPELDDVLLVANEEGEIGAQIGEAGLAWV
ncbi:hypothetical protein GCM10022198_24690 [Klugiella xanthotipulae]|uniref:Uncharacterized protein n=1 Tax=Klugiella xanthotipulae TaxID=244735 RepID=A0A543I657_9MICO|nr:hypothetical protein [Klugiella xanthotipulae]TQM66083.1 hypothetical protein FB466_0905 [Klugiella xanthotipulae]